jgi:hypothetical protein
VSGRARPVLVIAAVLSALHFAVPALASPPIARPNPSLALLQVDYAAPPTLPSGEATTFAPLVPSVIDAAVDDQTFLTFQLRGDLGGFVPAPVGTLVLKGSGGHVLTGKTNGAAEIPQFAQAAGGDVNSFAFLGEPPTLPPQPGVQPVRLPPPPNANNPPPPNQGFGGTPPPQPPLPTTETPPATTTEPTTTRPNPPPTTSPQPTTTTTTTTVATTTATTTTASPPPTTSPGSPPPPFGTSCGTPGLSITSDHSTCVLYAPNMAPGGSVAEVFTFRNEADVPVRLSMQASGTQNLLWSYLRLGIWQVDTAPPNPFPPLLWWTTQSNTLTTLDPGQVAKYNIELLLPTTAGNSVMGMTAVIDFSWAAQG